MNTASQQSLGGSTAGVTGQANLEAARTRNAGGFQGAIGSGSRGAAKQLSQNALGIQAANEQEKQLQKQTAISQLQQLYGIDTNAAQGYLGQSNSALEGENTGSVQANQTLWNNINGITGLAGKAATAGVGCWIAAAVYDGWDDPRTIAVREWLNTEFIKSTFGRIVMATYLKFGERIADQITRKPVLKHIFKPLFDAALRRARAV